MAPITLVDRLPGPADYNRLREAVGWGLYPLSLIEPALSHSLYGVCALVEGKVVGMARVIGDGGLAYHVHDVAVLPGYQRQGIGTGLMDRVMAYLSEHAPPGAMVGLMAAQGKEPFYARYGFVRRPNEQYGCGMILFWPP